MKTVNINDIFKTSLIGDIRNMHSSLNYYGQYLVEQIVVNNYKNNDLAELLAMSIILTNPTYYIFYHPKLIVRFNELMNKYPNLIFYRFKDDVNNIISSINKIDYENISCYIRDRVNDFFAKYADQSHNFIESHSTKIYKDILKEFNIEKTDLCTSFIQMCIKSSGLRELYKGSSNHHYDTITIPNFTTLNLNTSSNHYVFGTDVDILQTDFIFALGGLIVVSDRAFNYIMSDDNVEMIQSLIKKEYNINKITFICWDNTQHNMLNMRYG